MLFCFLVQKLSEILRNIGKLTSIKVNNHSAFRSTDFSFSFFLNKNEIPQVVRLYYKGRRFFYLEEKTQINTSMTT